MFEIRSGDAIILSTNDVSASFQLPSVFTQGMTGSLTEVSEGIPFIATDIGLKTTIGTNGQLMLACSDVRGFTLPNANIVVSSSMGTDFVLSSSTMTSNCTASLVPTKLQNTRLSFWLDDIERFYTIRNEGSVPCELFKSWAYTGRCKVDVKYVENDWKLDSVRVLEEGIELVSGSYPSDCILDIDPNVSSSYTLSGSTVVSLFNRRNANEEFVPYTVNPWDPLLGPTLEVNGWSSGTNCLQFSGDSQKLFCLESPTARALSGTFVPYTIYAVAQYTNTSSTPTRNEAIIGFAGNSDTVWPIGLTVDGAVYNSVRRSHVYDETARFTTNVSVAKHVYTTRDDGSMPVIGNETGPFSVVYGWDATGPLEYDVFATFIGGGKWGGVNGSQDMSANVKVARILGFARALSQGEHEYVINSLRTTYDV
jgi:hypothetical protein